jgi:alanine racemase
MRSWVEISRRGIAANFAVLRDVAGPQVEVAAVVKANAYGHGAVEVSRVLEAEGARWLAVAAAEEGVELRQAGLAARILVMSDSLPENRAAFFEHGLTPVVHALEELPPLDEMARRSGQPLPYHLKMDSGMGRMGTRASAAAVAEAVRSASHLRLEGFMSHLASAGDYASSQTGEQVRAFAEWREQLRGMGLEARFVHMAATLPIAHGRGEAFGNMVRPGLSLYGYIGTARGAAPPRILEVSPVLTWKARLVAVKEVPASAPIGYGALFRAPHAMRIGMAAAGYADGVPHSLTNRGQVIAAGRLVPMLGAVSMDLIAVDLTECPSLQTGDAVTLVGREGDVRLDAQKLAEAAGTIPYAILCGIGNRVKRVYV